MNLRSVISETPGGRKNRCLSRMYFISNLVRFGQLRFLSFKFVEIVLLLLLSKIKRMNNFPNIQIEPKKLNN